MSASSTATSGFTRWVSELARAHTRALAGVARAEGLSAEDALDTVQEALTTFLGLPQARSLVGEPNESRALLVVIVRHAARNLRRRHYRKKPHTAADDSTLVADLPGVDELIARAEDHIRLRGCVDRLAEMQRRIVSLRMLEEASGNEVATELALRPGHVAVLLHRAKKDLLACMTE